MDMTPEKQQTGRGRGRQEGGCVHGIATAPRSTVGGGARPTRQQGWGDSLISAKCCARAPPASPVLALGSGFLQGLWLRAPHWRGFVHPPAVQC